MTDKLPVTPKKKTRIRISDEMRHCVELMATEGLLVHVAAERANITRDTATRNIRKAHVLRLFKLLVKDVRDNASQAAYMRINHLSVVLDQRAGKARRSQVGCRRRRHLPGPEGAWSVSQQLHVWRFRLS